MEVEEYLMIMKYMGMLFIYWILLFGIIILMEIVFMFCADALFPDRDKLLDKLILSFGLMSFVIYLKCP